MSKVDPGLGWTQEPRLRLLPWLALVAVACGGGSDGIGIALPDSAPGIGFDDLRYSSSLHRLLVPSGRSGRLNLVEPDTLEVTSISGFSSKSDYSGGHDDGATSVEEVAGRLYVTDRTEQTLNVVDPAAKTVVGSTALAAEPDYVRYVAPTNELWVTEPSAGQLEVFGLDADGNPTSNATIAVSNGPESLVVDAARGLAFTHRWQATTIAIDVKTRSIADEWSNGCAASRGIAFDEAHGWLFAACNEGTVTVLDVDHDGKMLSTLARGSGFDVMGYAANLGHLYLAGGSCACLVIAGLDDRGSLAFLERLNAPSSTHCAAADDRGHAWLCDPDGGRVLRLEDSHGSSL